MEDEEENDEEDDDESDEFVDEDLTNMIDESDDGSSFSFRRSSSEVTPFLQTKESDQPVQSLDDLQDIGSTSKPPESESQFDYASPSQLYNAPYDADYTAASYASAGMQDPGSSGGGMGMARGIADDSSVAHRSLITGDSQGNVNIRSFQQNTGVFGSGDSYVSQPSQTRFEVERDPFKREDRIK